MTLKQFVDKYRLTIRRDECGDPIIAGRRGHLYFDGPNLCLMVIDGPRALRSRWEALGGKLWTGDISEGRQDVKITAIPLANAKDAIKLAGIRRRRVLSKATLTHLDKIRPRPTGNHSPALESIAEGEGPMLISTRKRALTVDMRRVIEAGCFWSRWGQ